MQFTKEKLKDLGLQREVFKAYPYAVVGGVYDASMDHHHDKFTVLSHIVPAGLQLKILFLRIWTQESGGAKFSIEQTNPTATCTTTPDAFPVVGSVPPYYPGLTAVRDYPMLEAAGAEVLHGNLEQPIHVLEGSIDFNILRTPAVATGERYGIVWWGVQKTPEDETDWKPADPRE